MQCKPVVDFFLGALSPSGFRGWFAEAAAEPGLTTYLVKAGPGCGKSTLMRRMASADAAHYAERGTARIERIHCSSDPGSLDGVLLTDVRVLFLDATAPHTLDCKYPGAAECVVSLYDALDNDRLRENRAAILDAGARNGALLQQASASFALACGVLQQSRAMAAQALDAARLEQFGRRLAMRAMKPRRGAAPGRQSHRLLSAPTPQGLTFYRDTVQQLADSVCVLHDDYGAAAPRLLALLATHARENGYDAILCHCPTDQKKLDHLILPAQGLAFVTADPWLTFDWTWQKNLHLRRFYTAEPLRAERRVLLNQRQTANRLLARTYAMQAKAKAVHDELEKYYIAAADFAAIEAARQRLETKLFA